MVEKRKRAVKDLTKEEVPYYLSLLNEEVCEFDCGELCAKDNNGEPYCCTVENAIPLLFKSEYEYFNEKGDLWYIWKAQSEDEKEIEESARKDQVFCDCGGASNCKRDLRSITCRTFPLEPYIDRRGVFVGLTFLYDFTIKDDETGKIKCPLTKKPAHIRQEFVDASFIFWEKIMLRVREEYDTYVDSSHDLRRKRDKKGFKLKILYPTWFQKLKSMKEYV